MLSKCELPVVHDIQENQEGIAEYSFYVNAQGQTLLEGSSGSYGAVRSHSGCVVYEAIE